MEIKLDTPYLKSIIVAFISSILILLIQLWFYTSPIYYIIVISIILVGTCFIYISYRTKDLSIKEKCGTLKIIYFSLFLMLISIFFYMIPFRYSSNLFKPTHSYGKDLFLIIRIFVLGCFTMVIARNILKTCLKNLYKESIIPLVECISYLYTTFLFTDILGILIGSIHNFNIYISPPFLSGCVMIGWTTPIGEIVVLGSLFGMGLQLLFIYKITQRLTILKLHLKLRLRLFISGCIILLYGIFIGFWGILITLSGRLYEIEPGKMLDIQVGIIEYLLIFIWGAVIVLFVINMIRLIRLKD